MHIITIDPLDGRGEIQVAVSNYVEAQRIHQFIKSAKAALTEIERLDEQHKDFWDLEDPLENPR